MKKSAFFILFLFTMAQALPTIKSLWGNEKAITLNITEEKKADKEEKKAGKEYVNIFAIAGKLLSTLNTQITTNDRILPAPSFQIPTPPPDFC